MKFMLFFSAFFMGFTLAQTPIKLEPGEIKEIKIEKNVTSDLRYYISLEEYQTSEEEGVITIFYDKNNQEKTQLKVKAMNILGVEGKNPEEYFPISSEYESPLAAYSPKENYHFYFFNTKYFGKGKYYFIQVEVQPSEDEATFSISFSKPHGEPYRVFSKGQTIDFSVAYDYVPIVKKYELTRGEDLGYTFSFLANDTILTGFTGKLAENVREPGTSGRAVYYTFPPDANDSTIKYFTIIFFTKKGDYSYFINSGNYKLNVYFREKKQGQKVLWVNLIDSYERYGLICEYKNENPGKGLIYIEKIFGDPELFYEDKLPENITSITSLFPDGKTFGDKIDNKYVISTTNLDLISVKCSTMCYFNVHIIDSSLLNPAELKEGQMGMFFLGSNTTLKTITGEKSKAFEIRNINLENLVAFWGDSGMANIPKGSSLESGLADGRFIRLSNGADKQGLAILRITEYYKDVFEEVTGEVENKEVQKKAIAFKIPYDQKSIAYSVDIETSSNSNGFNYEFQRGKIEYLTPPVNFHRDLPSKTKIKLKIYNPFYVTLGLKEQLEKEKNNIYFLINFDNFSEAEKPRVTFKPVDLSSKYEELKPNEIRKVVAPQTFYLEQQKELSQKLVTVMTRCSDYEVDLYFKYDQRELYSNFFFESEYNLFFFDPHQYRFELELRSGDKKKIFPKTYFYYKFASEEEINQFKVGRDFKVSLSQPPENKEEITISFFSPLNSTDKSENLNVTYTIYLVEVEDSSKNYSYCEIEELTSKIESTKSHTSNNRSISVNLNVTKPALYDIFVIGQPVKGISPKFIYKKVSFKKEKEKEKEKEKTKKKIIIPVLIGIIIVLIAVIVITVLIIKSKKKTKTNLDIEKAKDSIGLLSEINNTE